MSTVSSSLRLERELQILEDREEEKFCGKKEEVTESLLRQTMGSSCSSSQSLKDNVSVKSEE